MSGVITQLGSIGKQDVDVFINPTKTFWKEKNVRYTQFAMEPKTIEFQGSYGYGKTTHAILPRNGDLIPKLYIQVTLANLDGGNGGARMTDDIGRWLFEEIRFEVGSVRFDVMWSEYEHSKEELRVPAEKQPRFLTRKSESESELIDWAKNTQTLWIPVTFHFFQNWCDAYPIIALHLTESKLYVKFRSKSDVIKSATSSPYAIVAADAEIQDCVLKAETVFLDDAERDWFAETQHKYIIMQNQNGGSTTIPAGAKEARVDLSLNHPVKYLTILYRKSSNLANKEPFNFSGEETGELAGEAFKTMSLKLNGNDRIEKQSPIYYRLVQARQHWARNPQKHIYTYCFCPNPASREPEMTINFSRIDNVKLHLEFSAPLSEPADVMVFAENINVVTVGSGVMLLKYAS